jgi:hypothetical protein
MFTGGRPRVSVEPQVADAPESAARGNACGFGRYLPDEGSAFPNRVPLPPLRGFDPRLGHHVERRRESQMDPDDDRNGRVAKLG